MGCLYRWSDFVASIFLMEVFFRRDRSQARVGNFYICAERRDDDRGLPFKTIFFFFFGGAGVCGGPPCVGVFFFFFFCGVFFFFFLWGKKKKKPPPEGGPGVI